MALIHMLSVAILLRWIIVFFCKWHRLIAVIKTRKKTSDVVSTSVFFFNLTHAYLWNCFAYCMLLASVGFIPMANSLMPLDIHKCASLTFSKWPTEEFIASLYRTTTRQSGNNMILQIDALSACLIWAHGKLIAAISTRLLQKNAK